MKTEKQPESIQKTVKAYILRHSLIPPDSLILAGVSGGPDSMAMLYLLNALREELRFSLAVVHIHHGIRGAEADRDEALVLETCRKTGIQAHTFHYDVPALARSNHIGIEQAGRLARREAFSQVRELYASYTVVRTALAHNRGDQAETVLHHLCRGSGLRGLAGIRPRSAEIIHPILCLDRQEITAFLSAHDLPYASDSSNDADEYTRNRIRHHVLPVLEKEVHQGSTRTIAETADFLAEAEDCLTDLGEDLLKKGSRPEKEGLLLTTELFEGGNLLQRYAIRSALERVAGCRENLTSIHIRQVQDLFQRQTGRYIRLPSDLVAQKTYGGVLIKKETQTPYLVEETVSLPVPGTLTLPTGTLVTRLFPYSHQPIPEKKYTKWFDYDKIEEPLIVRSRQSGDTIRCLPDMNRKKLRRLMIDSRIPRQERDRIPIIAEAKSIPVPDGIVRPEHAPAPDGTARPELAPAPDSAIRSDRDRILWVVGVRMDDSFRIEAQTSRILEITWLPATEKMQGDI